MSSMSLSVIGYQFTVISCQLRVSSFQKITSPPAPLQIGEGSKIAAIAIAKWVCAQRAGLSAVSEQVCLTKSMAAIWDVPAAAILADLVISSQLSVKCGEDSQISQDSSDSHIGFCESCESMVAMWRTAFSKYIKTAILHRGDSKR